MNIKEKNVYINFRIESSEKSFNASKLLADKGFWNSSVNRLYYSVFYSINALLFLNNINIKSHSGLINQFSLHYIKTDKIDKKYGKLVAKLFRHRQKADYDVITNYNKELVEPLINSVEIFLKIIKKEINKKMK